jgi:steroid delta-isomerase-like uncharacterized protein
MEVYMTESLKNLMKDAMAAVNSHDVDKAVTFYADDCIYEDLGAIRVNKGKEEIKAYLSEIYSMSQDVKLDVKSEHIEGNYYASEWVMTGTNTGKIMGLPATRKKFTIRGASFFQIRDGKISHQTDYWNLMSFLQELGFISGTTPNRFGRIMMRLMMKRS